MSFTRSENQYRRHSRQVISRAEARAVLKFIFGRHAQMPTQFTDRHRRFAQYLLVEMLDKSIAMDIVSSLFQAGMEPGVTVTSICEKMINDGPHFIYGWFSLSSNQDVMDAADDITIYQIVVTQLRANFQSVWRDILSEDTN